MSALVLEIRRLCKNYAAPVLIDVDITVEEGEVHALVGANGAGKSTLNRIVSGLTRPDAGTLRLHGVPFRPATRSDAEAAGVQIVMQEFNLLDTLSVAENLYFNRLPRRFGFVSRSKLHADAAQALNAVGLTGVDPTMPVARLGVGKKQLVEIAAALARECRLLILDEPTAALTDPEIEILFAHIRRLQSAGVGILYVSHRMEEVRRIADRVTILRDGRVMKTAQVNRIALDEIIRCMVGTAAVEKHDFEARAIGEVALVVERLGRGDEVIDVGFEIRRGEIFGIAGLVGSGRTETLRAIFGADQADRGGVRIGMDGSLVRFTHPREAVRSGLGMIPEDRKEQGLLLPRSVRLNTSLANLKDVQRVRGWIDRHREKRTTDTIARRLGIHMHTTEQPVGELSGGNQQKVIIGRWMLRESDILLFDEPTRGIDVDAKATVYSVLGEMAAKGKALVVVSSELRELMAICDRIGVMSAGRMVATFGRGEWTEDAIMSAAISAYLHPSERRGLSEKMEGRGDDG